jgi:dienelactone hydrolase
MNRPLALVLAALPVLALAGALGVPRHASAKDAWPVETANVWTYKSGDVECEGVIAFPKGEGKKPAVLVVHDWMGVSPFVNDKVVQLSKMGYVAFGADVYGKGVRPANPGEAGRLAGKYKSDRALFRARLTEAFQVLVKHPLVDPKRIVAIGYCFGGTGAIELARSGADLVGVISFHGGLDSPTPADGKNIKAKVLALHGADDPYVPAADVLAFLEELRAAKVDWQFVAYGGAVHAFTNPAAGTDNSKGAAYNANADRRSWEAATTFFNEVFAPAK